MSAMNRSRPPRRARRGQSREPSPVDEAAAAAALGASSEKETDNTVAPPPRRSTRNRRGTPTPPPPQGVGAHDETNSTTAGDQSLSGAQHAQEKITESMPREEKESTNDSSYQDEVSTDSKVSEKLIEQSKEKGPSSAPAPSFQEASKLDKSPPVPSGTRGNGDSSPREIPMSLEENKATRNDDGPVEGDASVAREGVVKPEDTKPASSDNANGPGDDHGNKKGNEFTGSANESTGDKDARSDDVVDNAGASPVLLEEGSTAEQDGVVDTADKNKETSISSETGANSLTVEPGIRQESRTISLGSKSALEATIGGDNDNVGEPAKASSPQTSLESQNESQDQHNEALEENDASKEDENACQTYIDQTASTPATRDEDESESVTADSDGKTLLARASSHCTTKLQNPEAVTDNVANTNSPSAVNIEAPKDTPAREKVSQGPISMTRKNDTINDTTTHLTGSEMDLTGERTNLKVTEKSTDGVLLSTNDQKTPLPPPQRNVSSSAVASSACALEIRPTEKKTPRPQRMLNRSPEITQSTPAFLRHQQAEPVNVNDMPNGSAPLEPRKRRRSDEQPKENSISLCDQSEPKRQRQGVSTAIATISARDLRERRRERRKRNWVSNRKALREALPECNDIEGIKARLFGLACSVHRGSGPERRFSVYWEALSKFLSFQVLSGALSGDQSNIAGIQAELNSFLATKKMRKLHNRLVMGKFGKSISPLSFSCSSQLIWLHFFLMSGLLAKCTGDTIGQNMLGAFIPKEWQQRIEKQTIAVRDAGASESTAPEIDPSFDLTDFNLSSGMYATEKMKGESKSALLSLTISIALDIWTATGREPLISTSGGEAEYNHALIDKKEIADIHRHAPCLPGTLALDPKIREYIREESGLKVSEPAIWLLVVSVREYVQSLLKDTVSNLSSVETKQALDAIEFSEASKRSGNMDDAEKKIPAYEGMSTPTKENTNGSVTKETFENGKKRRITPLDLASAMTSTRLSAAGTLSGSVSHVAYERCCHMPFKEDHLFSPEAFGSVQSFVVDSMESASKKPRHDPAPPVAAGASKELPGKKPSGGTNSNVPPNGDTGKESKELAALKARATAATVAANASAGRVPQADMARQVPAAIAMPITRPAVPPTPPSTGRSTTQDRNATPPASLRPSPPAASPRGRGRGFATKDLAAMRARNTPPKGTSPTAPSTTPQQQEGSKAETSIGKSPPGATQNGGAGKELRRLQDNSPDGAAPIVPPQGNATGAAHGSIPSAAAKPANATGMHPRAVPVIREPNAME